MLYLAGMGFFHLTNAIRHKILTVLEVHSLLTKGGWGTKIDIVCAGVTQLVESLPSKQAPPLEADGFWFSLNFTLVKQGPPDSRYKRVLFGVLFISWHFLLIVIISSPWTMVDSY